MTTLIAAPAHLSVAEPIDIAAEMTGREAADMAEFAGAYSMDDMVRAMSPEAASQYGVRLRRIGSAVAHTARIDVPFFNRIVGLGLREPITQSTLDDVQALHRSAQVRFMVQVSPAALWDGLHARLETYGWTRHDNWAQLIRGVEPPPETLTDLRIERVFAERAEAITDIICTAFELPREYGAFFVQLVGRPRWRHYVVLDGETPVATGALFVRGLVGYLTFGATLSSHRGLGAQGAIMARRIKDAAALGCRWLVTETMEQTSEHSNPSYRNMLRMGFRLVYLRPNYIYFPR